MFLQELNITLKYLVGQYATVEDKLRELEAKKKEAASQSPSLELNFDKALRKRIFTSISLAFILRPLTYALVNKVLSSELQLPDEYLATGGAPANGLQLLCYCFIKKKCLVVSSTDWATHPFAGALLCIYIYNKVFYKYRSHAMRLGR
jgi:hypothetical protein